MLSISQSSFDLFKRLEQQLDTSKLITTTEIMQTEMSYTISVNRSDLGQATINVKTTKLTLIFNA